jgi:hypothetical protein
LKRWKIPGITVTTKITFTNRGFARTASFWCAEGAGMVRDFVEQDGAYFFKLVDNFISER